MPLLGCSFAGSISSVLAIFGLRKDQREFLVPYIFIMLVDLIITIIHDFRNVFYGEIRFEPLTGIIFTIDFFLISLNVSFWVQTQIYFTLFNFQFVFNFSTTDILSRMHRITISRVQKWWTCFIFEPLFYSKWWSISEG